MPLYSTLLTVSSQSEYSLTFSEEPDSQVLTDGDTLLLTCTLSTSPVTLTNVKWFRDDDELDGSHPNTISLSGQTSTLSITSFGSSHSGEYWCSAEYGSYGSLRSSSAIVGLACVCLCMCVCVCASVSVCVCVCVSCIVHVCVPQ